MKSSPLRTMQRHLALRPAARLALPALLLALLVLLAAGDRKKMAQGALTE